MTAKAATKWLRGITFVPRIDLLVNEVFSGTDLAAHAGSSRLGAHNLDGDSFGVSDIKPVVQIFLRG